MMKNLVDKTMFKFRTPVCSSLPLRASPEGIQFTSGNQQCQSLDMTTSDHMKSMAVLLLTYEIYWKMLMGSRVNWTRPRILWRKKSPSMSHFIISSVQFSSVAQRCLTLWDPMDCSMPGLPVHYQLHSLLKFMSIELVILSNHLIHCCPLLLLPSIFPRVFLNESILCIKLPKYWSFSFSIKSSNEFPTDLFRIDWFDLLAVQGTVKSLLQHHSSKVSILQHSAFFMFQLSHPYMTTGKIMALTKRTFAGKVVSLLFNMLSSLVIVFLPRSKHLLISWL